jgi:hypothetical protein
MSLSLLPQQQSIGPSVERHFTIGEIASMWGLCPNTVRKIFEDMEGVLKVSYPRLKSRSNRKPRVSLRIPASLVARVHEDWSRGFGSKVQLRRGGIQ